MRKIRSAIYVYMLIWNAGMDLAYWKIHSNQGARAIAEGLRNTAPVDTIVVTHLLNECLNAKGDVVLQYPDTHDADINYLVSVLKTKCRVALGIIGGHGDRWRYLALCLSLPPSLSLTLGNKAMIYLTRR